jgi:hypothetical protein
VSPRQLCNKLLHNSAVWISLREGAHVSEISSGKPRHLGEGMTQIRDEAVDYLCAPSFIALPPQNDETQH